jgi:hypothetical protein
MHNKDIYHEHVDNTDLASHTAQGQALINKIIILRAQLSEIPLLVKRLLVSQ